MTHTRAHDSTRGAPASNDLAWFLIAGPWYNPFI